MYLKSIELQGFKSFTDKTSIKLDGGISCIVGPNGSGKSNISDAIRWVLGEQSARNLRGNKMQDVIFSGSDSRKALGMAQVTLHIDNTDGKLPMEFTDVEVCRRAYRSGDSEYLINGQQCRLKDIQELFLDSGVSNNSLALVGQGRVQQIVDMKPEERRSLIEEAAGVIKYRNRKKSAVRRLADTESNLARVWDIISELAGRLEPLAEQKEKAERFLELKTEADAKEINLLLQILDENKELIDKIKAETVHRQDVLIKAETEFNKINAENELLKADLQGLENNLSVAQQELFALRTDKERADSQSVLLQERSTVAADNIKRLEDEIALLLNKDDGFMLQVQQLEAESAEKTAARDHLAEAIKLLEAEYQEKRRYIEELDATTELTRDELFDLANQLTGCRNQLTYQAQTLAENKARRQSLEAARKELAAGRGGLEIEKERLNNELTELRNKINSGKNKRQKIVAELDAINNDKVKIAEQEVNTRLQLNSLQSRLKVLQEFAENLEGFHPGVRALLKAKKQNLPIGSRIVGSVVDLIDIEPQYTTAIEAALAAGMQNLVVQSADDAKAAVDYLKKEQLGRATFLPIDDLVIKPHPVLEKNLGQPGVIGRCADVVKCDAAHRVVIEYLLNNILLVDNLDTAVKIARQNKHSFKIITLEADLIRTGGAITGGSQAKNSGDLLKKRTQLKALENQVKDLTAAQLRYQEEINKLKEQEKLLEAERADIDSLLKTGDIELVTISKDIEHLASRISGQESQAKMYDNEITMLAEEEIQLIARGKELEDQIANWQELNDNSNNKLVELQNQLQTSRAELESASQNINEKSSELAAAEQICLSYQAETARLRQEKSSLFAREADLKRDLADWQKQADEIISQQENNKNTLLRLAAEILQAEETFGMAGDVLTQNKNRIDELTTESYRLNRELNLNRQELHQLELKETRLQTEWDNESAKLAEAFCMTYEEALPYLDKDYSRKDLQRSVKALRAAITELGNVNVDAIEEYQQVFERHSFLTTQRQDLLDARDSLNKVIREMDAIMIKKFSAAFKDVNDNFDRTFCKLFGGGSAGLVMTDPDDVLETGIEIVVQPPGKKVVNYNLLSGGEKSLIGISLILAVFQVNPSPLCVLDEVDAALDEANVDRFGQYLQEFKDKTQFIVVSHRQGTMEAAGSLWGVTMAADGVSKLVSVKLSDIAEITDMTS